MSFAAAFAKVLQYEGVHSNDVFDRGGDTWYGISRVAHPEIRPWPPTDSVVSQFYHNQWDDSGAIHVPEPADTAYFLAYINMGPRRAIQCLQRAIRANGRACLDDGDIGPNTLRMLGGLDGKALATALHSEVAAWYRLLVAENYSDGRFLVGWLKRAYEEPL